MFDSSRSRVQGTGPTKVWGGIKFFSENTLENSDVEPKVMEVCLVHEDLPDFNCMGDF